MAATFYDADGKQLLDASGKSDREDVAPSTSTADLIDTVCNPGFGKTKQKGVYPAGDELEKFAKLYFQTQASSKPAK